MGLCSQQLQGNFPLPSKGSLYPLTDSSHARKYPTATHLPLSPLPTSPPPLPLPAATAPIVTARGTERPGWSRALPFGTPPRSRGGGGGASFLGSTAPELTKQRITRPVRQPCLWSSSCGFSPSPPSWSSSASPRTRQARRLPPLHLLKVHALSANPVQILRGTGQLLPSFGIKLPVVRGDLTEFDAGFSQRCCSCSAIHPSRMGTG